LNRKNDPKLSAYPKIMHPMHPPRRSWKERDGNMAHTSSWESLSCWGVVCDRWRPVDVRRPSMSTSSRSVRRVNILILSLLYILYYIYLLVTDT